MTCSDLRIVLVTCPSKETAQEISKNLVETKLSACVNIIPDICSIYFWEGKIEKSSECLLMIKTLDALIPKLEDAIKKLHPYTTPEFLVIETEQVGKKYYDWVRSYLGNKV